MGCRYDAYSFSIIPAMGQIVSGDRASYQYLVESIRKFPPQVCCLLHDMFINIKEGLKPCMYDLDSNAYHVYLSTDFTCDVMFTCSILRLC